MSGNPHATTLCRAVTPGSRWLQGWRRTHHTVPYSTVPTHADQQKRPLPAAVGRYRPVLAGGQRGVGRLDVGNFHPLPLEICTGRYRPITVFTGRYRPVGCGQLSPSSSRDLYRPISADYSPHRSVPAGWMRATFTLFLSPVYTGRYRPMSVLTPLCTVRILNILHKTGRNRWEPAGLYWWFAYFLSPADSGRARPVHMLKCVSVVPKRPIPTDTGRFLYITGCNRPCPALPGRNRPVAKRWSSQLVNWLNKQSSHLCTCQQDVQQLHCTLWHLF